MHLIAKGQHSFWRSFDLGQSCPRLETLHPRQLTVEEDRDLGVIHDDDVLHAANGTSSHTVSTWAVCGNMSKG